MDTIIGNILLIFLFILVGGVFAAAEMALVSLRESQLEYEIEEDDDLDEADDELEDALSAASNARTPAELEAEIRQVERLVAHAHAAQACVHGDRQASRPAAHHGHVIGRHVVLQPYGCITPP